MLPVAVLEHLLAEQAEAVRQMVQVLLVGRQVQQAGQVVVDKFRFFLVPLVGRRLLGLRLAMFYLTVVFAQVVVRMCNQTPQGQGPV